MFNGETFLGFQLQCLFLFPLGNQFSHYGVFGGLVVFGGVLDVDLPTRQPCGQSHVLPFTADGQAQLIGGHQHMGMLTGGVNQAHHLHPGWTEGIGDVLAGVLRPADNINFFASQFIHHLLDAGSAGADAGSNWIHLALDAVDSHLRAWSNGA